MRAAFSLLELLIVVVIIGLIYTLALPNFASLEQKKSNLTLADLKSVLQNTPHEERIAFLCIQECKECFLEVDSQRVEDTEKRFENFLDATVQRYKYEQQRGMVLLEKELYFKDENSYEELCFSYTIDKQLGGDAVYIAYGGKIYDYATAFTTPIYNSIEEVQEMREKLEMDILR